MEICFRLLMEYYSFLYGKTLKLNRREKVRTFPSPYGVSLILILITYLIYSTWSCELVSVSLRSITHSYAHYRLCMKNGKALGFPSPYGVLFILIMYAKATFKDVIKYKFPSPYEVTFTFILYSKKNCIIINF